MTTATSRRGGPETVAPGNSFCYNLPCFTAKSPHLGIRPGTTLMKPFAKLSSKQWAILCELAGVWWVGQAAQASREDGVPEAERVATVRAYSSLVRRGLVARVKG